MPSDVPSVFDLERRTNRRRAGRSATVEYEKLKREWRARNKSFFRRTAAVVFVVIVASLFVAGGEVRGWIAGVAAGCALAFLIITREAAPGWIERYLVGAVGEERTAKALEPMLGSGWHLVSDVRRNGFNIDHVLIGPGGVFVLETKNLSGTVEVRGDWARLTRPQATRHEYGGAWWARQARRHAADASALFKQRVKARPWVQAVVVLWADFPQGVADGDRVTFVAGERLLAWLNDRPKSFSDEKVAGLVSALTARHRVTPD